METKEFGGRLRELRKQAGFSQRELADRVGVNFSYLSKIESGAMPPPSQKVILRLAEALTADKDELITLAGKIPADIAPMLQNRETLQFLRSRVRQKKAKASNKIRGAIPMNFKNFARVALAVILVVSIGASLWYASPTPVRALEMSFPSLPATGTLSQTYSFTVKIDISAVELLPITNIDLEIYNLASPITYKATLTNLPLTATTKSYTSAQTRGGAASVTATVSNWGWGYGYGYAVWQGTPQYFGYGYGYGSPGVIASITYAVTWTSPSGWPAGDYKAKATITANTTTFTKTSSSFTLSAEEEVPPEAPPVTPPVVVPPVVVPPVVVPPVVVPPVVVPPVVVPPEAPPVTPPEAPPVTPPVVTDVSASVTPVGVFTEDVTAKSEDAKVELTIPTGTTGLTATGEPLSEISIAEMEEPPLPSEDANVIGLVYDLGPDGATFAPPITLTFTYDPALIPDGVLEENLVIAMWDADAGEWGNLVSTVDPVNNTITVFVSHFTPFTVIAHTRPAAFVTSDLSITPAVVDIGETVTIRALVTNTGNFTDSYTVTLKINNVTIATKDVTLAGGVGQKVTFTISKDVAGTYTVNVDGLSGTFTVKTPPPPAPAAFVASDLSITPIVVDIGETVTISALVANTGDLTGSYKATLQINNVAIATKDVTLAGGTSQTVTFTTTKDAPGTYTVNINDLSGIFVVKAPPVPIQPTNWGLIIGGIIAWVIVIGLIIWLVVSRRRA